jgi:hypothetical protein
MTSFQGSSASKIGTVPFGEVVEIGLLLPAGRAEALVQLSRQRRQTVAQLIRSLIDDALAGEPASATSVPTLSN